MRTRNALAVDEPDERGREIGPRIIVRLGAGLAGIVCPRHHVAFGRIGRIEFQPRRAVRRVGW